MLKRLLGPGQKLDAGLALAIAFVFAAVLYSVVYSDPNVGLFALPFFALGCRHSKRPLVLIALSLIPAAALELVSYVKHSLVGMPLVVYDHYFLRSNVIMLAYNDWRVASGLVLFAVLTVLYLRALLSGKGPFSGFERNGMVALSVLSIVSMVSLHEGYQDIDMWEPMANAPTLRTLMRSTHVPGATLQVASTPAPIHDADHDPDHGFGAPAGGLPDIFLVLQESTFNPAMLRPGYEPKALFAKDAAQGGPLRVHTFAGGTWRTEFSVAIQMRPQEFGNDGLYVFHQLEGRIKRSVFTELKKLGYRVAIFYPVPGSFINAAAFYASIGVDEFYDPESLGIASGWDWKSPDANLYQAMLKKVSAMEGPVVALMLTIHQHGPHAVEDPFADYVTRFEDSDAAYGAFIQALAQRGKKAGVVAFGDHQPEFTARFLNDDVTRFITNYDIRCVNFECAAGPRIKPIDAVMLAPEALERFGFALDSFSLRQREVFQACTDDIDRCGETTRLNFNAMFSPFFD